MFKGSSKDEYVVALVLHFLIFLTATLPFATGTVPYRRHNIDPTYVIFRNFTFLPFHAKIIIRCILVFFTSLHFAILVFGFAILHTNVLFWMLKPLHEMCTGSNQFAPTFLKFRQLQIINQVWNELYRRVMLFGVFSILIILVIMGYILIKLTFIVPLSLTFMAGSQIICAGLMLHFAMPLMVQVTKRSTDFVRYWEMRGCSSHRKRKLRSCSPLKAQVGELYYVERESKVKFVSRFMDYTLSLSISN